MNELQGTKEQDWAAIRPAVDEALAGLGDADRNLLLLRYFEGQSYREVGDALGFSEDAARMRVTRALEKLREFFAQRGVKTTSQILAETLSTQGVHAAPLPLVGTIITAALLASQGSAPTAAAVFLIMTKAKATVAGILIATGLVAPALWQADRYRRLETDNRNLRMEMEGLRAARDLVVATSGKEQERQAEAQNQELAKLRGELAQARREMNDRKRTETLVPTARPEAAGSPGNEGESSISESEMAAFLQRPKVEQGDSLGRLRRQMMGLESRTNAEFKRNLDLATAIRPKLEELESHPDQFAEFQASFIKTAIGLEDDQKVGKIREILEETYGKAVAEKLDAPSRPSEGGDEWALRRDALDRPATRAVQQLLTEEERARFDRVFLGVMGIDLGIQDGAWHRFVLPGGGVTFPSEQATVKP